MIFMKKLKNYNNICILIPVYNDWASLNKLLKNINNILKKNQSILNLSIFIVNDNSSEKFSFKKIKKNHFKNIFLLNLKKNLGHDRAIVTGLYYIFFKKNIYDLVITMDGDGEDNPKYLKNLIDKHIKFPRRIIVCKRKKRSEGIIFKFLYYSHLAILLILTFRWLNHGGFNAIPQSKIGILLKSGSIWGNYSASLEISKIKKIYLPTARAKRYFGKSKINFFKLLLHSLTIMTVFKSKIILMLFFYFIIINLFFNFLILSILTLLTIIIGFKYLSLRESKLYRKKVFKNIFFLKKII